MKRKEKNEIIGAVRESESNRLKKLKEKTWNKTRQKTWNKGAKNRSVCSLIGNFSNENFTGKIW